MSDDFLSNCNGCLIINNDNIITLPSVGKTNSYIVNFQNPCFIINNNFISPILRCYNVVLPNPVSLEFNDKLRIKIKMPKQILCKTFGYTLETLVSDLQKNNFSASLRFKTSNGCIDINRCVIEENELEINDYCGWICITINYHVGCEEEHKDIDIICNLCEISYSLCFDPVRIKVLYGMCNNNDEVVNFESEICLELENSYAKRGVNISRYINGDDEIRIIGPENFICLKIIYDKDSIISNINNFNNILIFKGTNISIDQLNIINNNLPEDQRFRIQICDGGVWIDYTNNLYINEDINTRLNTEYIK